MLPMKGEPLARLPRCRVAILCRLALECSALLQLWLPHASELSAPER